MKRQHATASGPRTASCCAAARLADLRDLGMPSFDSAPHHVPLNAKNS